MEKREYGADFNELERCCKNTAREIAGGLERAEEEQRKSPCDSATGHAMLRLARTVYGLGEESAGMEDVRKAFEDYCHVYARKEEGFCGEDMKRAGTLTRFFSVFPDLEEEALIRMLEEAEGLSDAPDVAWLLGNLYEDGAPDSEKEKKALAWYQKARQKILPRREVLGILNLEKGDENEYYDDAAASKVEKGFSEEIQECLEVDCIVSRGLVRCYEAMGDRMARFTTLLYMARECRGVHDYRLSMDVARCYEEGDGTAPDYDLALDWYDISSEHAFTDYPDEVAESLYGEVEMQTEGMKSTLKRTCRKLAEILEKENPDTKTDQAALILAKAIASEEDVYKAFGTFAECILEEGGSEEPGEGGSSEDDSSECDPSEYAEIRSGSFLNGFWTIYVVDTGIQTRLEDEAGKRKTPYLACLLGNLCESYPGQLEKEARDWYRMAREKAQACLNDVDIDAKSRGQYEEILEESRAGLERCDKALRF